MAHYGVQLRRSDALSLPTHQQAAKRDTLVRWCKLQRKAGRPIAIDLFSGAGGLSAGVEMAGWAVAAAVDHDARALETHRHNFPGLALDLDLSEESGRDELVHLLSGIAVDLVAGGPPCQPFSRAGSSKIRSLVQAGIRDERDTRRELWAAFLEIALRLSPRAILMENVPDMGLGDDFRVIRYMVDELESAGYVTSVQLVDAWRFGVPQHRKRLILLARRDGRPFTWPSEQEPVTTLMDSIGDLPKLGESMGARRLTYEAPAGASAFVTRMRDGAEDGVVYDHMTRAVRPDDLEVFKLMDSKTLYSDIPEHLRRYKVDTFDDKYKRLDWHDVGRSITAHIAKDGYWYIHPAEHRTLTVREAARLQTFPDVFRFAGTRSDAFRQIGNAVPPLLGQAAASALTPKPGSPMAKATDWRSMRSELASWADKQRDTTYWFALPGSSVTLPVALAVAVTSHAPLADSRLAEALSHMRGLTKLSQRNLDSAIEVLYGSRAARSLERLRPLLPLRKAWADPAQLSAAVNLKPAEQSVFAMLQGGDVLLRSQGVLRIAARVAGTESHEVNRLTDGRVDLSRLVGSGSEAPLRMAGLRLLAITHCTVGVANCNGCPLLKWCHAARAA